MKPFAYIVGVLCLAVAYQCVAEGPPPLGVCSRGRIVRILDGDTADVEVRYVVRVRFASCWAPEKNTADGEKAWEDLQFHAGGKEVVVHIPTAKARSLADVLTLNRVVGSVWLKGADESLSDWQIKRGNATKTKQ
jgi:endonuclease YncB( thermonuclease family)